MSACKKEFTPADGAPPSPQVVPTGDMSLVSVDKPDQFPLVAAETARGSAELNVTGAVFPDIAREIPVISLANGRVVDIKARLDDYVKKGQLLLKVQSPDVTNAFDAYLKAVNDEQHDQQGLCARARTLYEHGAISQAMLEQAEDAEKDAQADLTAAEEQLKTLGVDKNHPSSRGRCLCADLRRHRCAERDPGGRSRRQPLRLGDGLHHRRPVRRLDRLRCLRERHSQAAAGAGSADQTERLS